MFSKTVFALSAVLFVVSTTKIADLSVRHDEAKNSQEICKQKLNISEQDANDFNDGNIHANSQKADCYSKCFMIYYGFINEANPTAPFNYSFFDELPQFNRELLYQCIGKVKTNPQGVYDLSCKTMHQFYKCYEHNHH